MQQRKGDSKAPQFPTPAALLADAEKRMKGAVDALRRDVNSLRTGRANASLVENVSVDYYGTPTSLSQLATINVPEPRLIVIQPWDRQAIPLIERALLKSDVGVTPVSDAQVVRVPIPMLTEERRRDIVKLLRKKAEESKISARNVRRDVADVLKDMEKGKALSQDETRRQQEALQKALDKHIAEIEQLASQKEAEIMQV